MSESALKTAYEAALKLPEAEQAEAAELLTHFVDERASLRLSDEQVAELRRRLAKPNPKFYSQEEVFAEVRRLLVK
jgi:hypothetical protein